MTWIFNYIYVISIPDTYFMLLTTLLVVSTFSDRHFTNKDGSIYIVLKRVNAENHPVSIYK